MNNYLDVFWSDIVRRAYDKGYLSSIGKGLAGKMRLIRAKDSEEYTVLVDSENIHPDFYIFEVEKYGPALLRSAAEIAGGNVEMTFIFGRL